MAYFEVTTDRIRLFTPWLQTVPGCGFSIDTF
jgi:hypothetical protein